MVRIQTRGIAIVDRRLQAGQLRHAAWQRPDGARIAAMSGAMAVNLLALLLLLIPMSVPPPELPVETSDDPDVVLIPRPVVETVPVTPPQPVQRREPTALPQPLVPVVAPVVAPLIDVPIVAESGEAAPPVVDATPTVASIEPAPAIAAVRLEYADAPPPTYPRDAERRRLEGTVMLQVLVGTDGRPLDVKVHASSGHRSLDEAARNHVLKRWSFRPAMRDGSAVQAIGLVPVAFELR